MKKKIPSVMLSGVLLLINLVLSGCSHSPNELSFEQDRKLYIIDKESAVVSVFTPEGKFTQKIGPPGAGPDQQEILLPEEIIRFLLTAKGSISGLVWNDLNGNQIRDTGEQGVQDVRVFIDTNNNATYDPADSESNTDANGNYTITRVKPGTSKIYVDTSTIANGYGFTTPHPYPIVLARNQLITDIDFGIQDQSGFIAGTIWDQTDNVPVSGVRVYADLNNDDDFSSNEPNTFTDSLGNYAISAIPIGTFNIRVDNRTLDVMYHRTPVQGTNPTLITFVSGSSHFASLSYIHKATICGTLIDTGGRQSGNVFLFIDLNHNEAYDNGEPMTFTNDSGGYCFNELMPGEYTLQLVMQQWDGYTISSPGALLVGEGDAVADVNFFLEANPATIGGIVWNDQNGDGILNNGETGLTDVTVFMDSNNNGTADANESSTVTDNAGAFEFTGLGEGSYYIRVDDSTLLDAYIPTTSPNPMFTYMKTGKHFNGARFGYQSKLAPMHTLRYPTRLTWGSGGKLYVSDNVNGSVFIYDSSLNLQGELKKLAKPLAVSTDDSGNIYVGNQGRNNVEVYDALGNLMKTIGDGFIAVPNDIALDRDNNIYILDSSKDSILKYNLNGDLIASIGDSFVFDYAVSIAINYRDDGSGTEVGELYVADQPNCTIHVFTLNGIYKKSIGSCGSLYTTNWDGKFAGLVAVDIDQDGNIHGLDNSLNVVQVFEPQNGTFMASYNAYPVNNEFFLNLQTDISIHPVDNRVIISNVATKSVELIPMTP